MKIASVPVKATVSSYFSLSNQINHWPSAKCYARWCTMDFVANVMLKQSLGLMHL